MKATEASVYIMALIIGAVIIGSTIFVLVKYRSPSGLDKSGDN